MVEQMEMFGSDQAHAFGGHTYEPLRDFERLNSQLQRVQWAMLDGAWHTLPDLAEVAGGSVASVSARLRDLRKEKHGSNSVLRRYIRNGLFEYRMEL